MREGGFVFLSGLAVVVLLVSVYIAFVMRDENKPITLRYHGKEAKIEFDEEHVPNITGETDPAVYYALGYAHGQDRLWQINMLRALTMGRMSEILGDRLIELDKIFLNFGFGRIAKEGLLIANEYSLNALNAYVEGINYYAKNSQMLPVEFQLTNTNFELLTTHEALTIGMFLCFSITSQWFATILRTSIAQEIGLDLAEKIMPLDDSYSIFGRSLKVVSEEQLKKLGIYSEKKENHTRPEFVKKFDRVNRRKERVQDKAKIENHDLLMKNIPSAGLSNSWVIHGNLTTTGKPILAVDPHISSTQPVMFSMAILNLKNGPVAGFTMPGIPAVMFGRSNYSSWGFTTSFVENMDVYALKLDAARENYFHDGAWKPLKRYEHIIKVKKSESILHYTYETHHGAVLFPISKAIAKHMPEVIQYLSLLDYPVALNWVAYRRDRSLAAILGMMNAQSFSELVHYGQMFDSSAENLAFATVDGHIGVITSGAVPKRESIISSAYIRDGTNKSEDWVELIPEKDMPRTIDPKEGYIVSCNNKIAPDSIKGRIGTTGPITSRSIRADEIITDVIKRKEKIDTTVMMKMQTDTLDIYAREIVPYILSLIDKHNSTFFDHNTQYTKKEREGFHEMVNILKKWDYDASSDSQGALVFNVWTREFKETMLLDQFPEQPQRKLITNSYYFLHFMGNLIKNMSNGVNFDMDICLAQPKKHIGSCLYSMFVSLMNTYRYIIRSIGENRDNWRWGTVCSIVHPHTPFSKTALKFFFQTERPCSGSANTLNVGKSTVEDDRYETSFYGTNRIIANMDATESLEYSSGSGQSGNPFSKFYFDGSAKYKKGKYSHYQK